MIRALFGQRDYFNLLTLAAVAIFTLLGLYWLAAIALGGLALVLGLGSNFTARLFRWPVKKIAIPLAMALQVGRNRAAAWLGILLVNLCLVVALGVIRDFHTPAVRRLGQVVSVNNAKLGAAGGYLESLAGQIVGRQRLDRWSAWLWAENMQTDDTHTRYARDKNYRVAPVLFTFSDRLTRWGVDFSYKVYEGEYHAWFVYAYWFVIALFMPCFVVSFLLTVFQLSARRLTANPTGLTIFIVSVLTLGLLYAFFAASYLMPFVSHPYHNMNVPFWFATILYVFAGFVCFGIVRANQQILFSPEEAPESFVNPRSFAREKTAIRKKAAPTRQRAVNMPKL